MKLNLRRPLSGSDYASYFAAPHVRQLQTFDERRSCLRVMTHDAASTTVYRAYSNSIHTHRDGMQLASRDFR